MWRPRANAYSLLLCLHFEPDIRVIVCPSMKPGDFDSCAMNDVAFDVAHVILQVDNERDYLMTVICEACTQGITDEVKENAFECLGRIAELSPAQIAMSLRGLLRYFEQDIICKRCKEAARRFANLTLKEAARFNNIFQSL